MYGGVVGGYRGGLASRSTLTSSMRKPSRAPQTWAEACLELPHGARVSVVGGKPALSADPLQVSPAGHPSSLICCLKHTSVSGTIFGPCNAHTWALCSSHAGWGGSFEQGLQQQ